MDLGRFSLYICGMCNILANIRCLMDKDLSMCMRSIIKICITNPCKTTFKEKCAHEIVITNFKPKFRTRMNVKLSDPISKIVVNSNHMSYYKMND